MESSIKFPIDIVCYDRKDIDKLYDWMMDIINKTGVVTVARLFTRINVEGKAEDSEYGWTSVADVEIKHSAVGYYMVLPVPARIIDASKKAVDKRKEIDKEAKKKADNVNKLMNEVFGDNLFGSLNGSIKKGDKK